MFYSTLFAKGPVEGMAKRAWACVLTVALVFSFCPFSTAFAAGASNFSTTTENISSIDPNAEIVEGELLVIYDDAGEEISNEIDAVELSNNEQLTAELADESTLAKAVQELNDLDVEVVEEVLPSSDENGTVSIVEIPESLTMEEAVEELASLPGVAYVQPNYVYELMDDEIEALDELELLSTTTDDSYVKNNAQFNLSLAKFFEAWDAVQCENAVEVAVFDTGCNLSHPDLVANLDSAYAYDVTYGTNGTNLRNAGVENNGDGQGHGTHVAGIIGAEANNGIGIAGGSYNAKILPVKIFKEVDGRWTSDTGLLLKAYQYVDKLMDEGKLGGLRVINLSLGGPGADYSLERAINAMLSEHGVLSICAAGNDGVSTPSYPSDFESCISVMSLNRDGSVADYSDQNAAKDIYTYGGDGYNGGGNYIVSTTADGSYGRMRGTSQACPLVSSAAALLFAIDPGMTASQVRAALLNSGTPVAGGATSAKALDAQAAVAYAKKNFMGIDDQPVEEDNGMVTVETAGNGLGLVVTHPKTAAVNTPIEFTLAGKNGSGTYRYLTNYVYKVEQDGSWNSVPFGSDSFNSKGTKTLTISETGDYKALFYVADFGAAPIATARIYVDFKVVDEVITEPEMPSQPDNGSGDFDVPSGPSIPDEDTDNGSDNSNSGSTGNSGNNNGGSSNGGIVTAPNPGSGNDSTGNSGNSNNNDNPNVPEETPGTDNGSSNNGSDQDNGSDDEPAADNGSSGNTVNPPVATTPNPGSGNTGNSGNNNGGSSNSGNDSGNSGTVTTPAPAPLPSQLNISYSTHVANIGWQAYVANGAMAGTSGKSYPIEAIKIQINNNTELSGGIQYSARVQNNGWMSFMSDNEIAGTSGKGLKLEAIKIKLTGEFAENYDIYYRVHAQNIGWMAWAKNGEPAGTSGLGYRLEAIQIVAIAKGEAAPGTTYKDIQSVVDYAHRAPMISYTTHVQNDGWQAYVSDGAMAGTSGRSLRLEGIKIKTDEGLKDYSGSIVYNTHIQNIGWQGSYQDLTNHSGWKKNDEMSGTSGQSLRLEAIQIDLTGELKANYDVYYRVHAENVGWMGWAKNGELSGTAGYSYRLEGIQVVLVEKGGSAPSTTFKGLSANTTQAYKSK